MPPMSLPTGVRPGASGVAGLALPRIQSGSPSMASMAVFAGHAMQPPDLQLAQELAQRQAQMVVQEKVREKLREEAEETRRKREADRLEEKRKADIEAAARHLRERMQAREPKPFRSYAGPPRTSHLEVLPDGTVVDVPSDYSFQAQAAQVIPRSRSREHHGRRRRSKSRSRSRRRHR